MASGSYLNDSVTILSSDEDQSSTNVTSEEDSSFQNLPVDDPVRGFSSKEIAGSSCGNAQSSLHRTPLKKKFWRNGICVLKRVNVTPTPDFHSFTTPVIKQKLSQNGFRICARRKAIRLLTKAYKATHLDLDEDGNFTEPSHVDTPCVKKSISKRMLIHAKKSCDLDDGTVNSEGDGRSIPEESILLPNDDVGTQQESSDLHNRLLDCFRNDSNMRKRILRFEPLSLKALQEKSRENGIRCSSSKLVDFLDSQCITFTVKESASDQARPRKKCKRKKKGSP